MTKSCSLLHIIHLPSLTKDNIPGTFSTCPLRDFTFSQTEVLVQMASTAVTLGLLCAPFCVI
jgi:hypothetical protein